MYCFHVRLTQLFPSVTGMIVPKWDLNNCSQVTLARLFPSETDTIAPKWDWHNCSQVRLVQLFPSETYKIVLNWHWQNWSQVTLAQFLPSEIGTIVPKRDKHDCCQARLAGLFQSGFLLSNLYFVFQLIDWHDSSLVTFTCEKLCYWPGLWRMIQYLYSLINNKSILYQWLIDDTFMVCMKSLRRWRK